MILAAGFSTYGTEKSKNFVANSLKKVGASWTCSSRQKNRSLYDSHSFDIAETECDNQIALSRTIGTLWRRIFFPPQILASSIE
jgi:hypothetical protein